MQIAAVRLTEGVNEAICTRWLSCLPGKRQEEIFDSFYRTDRARTNVRSGSGLGLAITKQIIDRHSGKIWASGSIGKGLTICIQLPAVNPEPKQ